MPKVTVHEISEHTFIAECEDRLVGTARLKRKQRDSNQWVLDTLLGDTPRETVAALFESIAKRVPLSYVTWWVRGDMVHLVDTMAADISVKRDRLIHRMECNAADFENITATRPFTYDDENEIVRINNDAFDFHPDRARLTVDHLRDEIAELGGRVDDLLIYEDVNGIGGFVWLKEQQAPHGEIYVLAVDQAHRGKGVGNQLLRSGINHLSTKYGASTVLLYVESTNRHAIEVYEANGFKDVGQPLVSFVQA